MKIDDQLLAIAELFARAKSGDALKRLREFFAAHGPDRRRIHARTIEKALQPTQPKLFAKLSKKILTAANLGCIDYEERRQKTLAKHLTELGASHGAPAFVKGSRVTHTPTGESGVVRWCLGAGSHENLTRSNVYRVQTDRGDILVAEPFLSLETKTVGVK